MNEITVRIYSDEVNSNVIQTPGRHFPGMLIQGDSLRILYRIAERIKTEAKDVKNVDLHEEIDDLCEQLSERLAFYETVLDKHGMGLPYADRVSKPTI